MRMTMETAALTSVAAVGGGIVCAPTTTRHAAEHADALTYEMTNIAQALTGLLPPLYGMSLLYSLNARESIRVELTEKSVVSGRGSLHPAPPRLDIGLTSHASHHSVTLRGQLVSSPGGKTTHFKEPTALYTSQHGDSADGASHWAAELTR